jgi:hypothetical protein
MQPHDFTVPQTYVVEPEWQATARGPDKMRRVADSRERGDGRRYDASALTDALCLNPLPLAGAARKIAANYAIPYDILVDRVRRRNRATAADRMRRNALAGGGVY